MRFQRERVSPDLLDEIRPLALRHFEAVDPLPDLEHKLNGEFYLAGDAAGTIRVFTARGGDGALLGYAVFFVGFHQHYRASIQAIQDAIYLSPESRKGWDGVKFIRWCDDQLASEGVQIAHHFSPLGARSLAPILKRLGYEMEQVVYARKLQ